MNWVVIGIIALAVIIVICIIIKLHLKKKLDSIDGLNGSHITDLNHDGETVIGNFGDDKFS
jgi:hypothetical protein